MKVRLRIDMVNGQSEAFIVRLKKEGDWYGDGEGEGVAVGWGGGDEMSRACC